MKVVIDNKIYDGNDQPILLILSKEDKENIGSMTEWARKYCVYPEEYDPKDIKELMKKYE